MTRNLKTLKALLQLFPLQVTRTILFTLLVLPCPENNEASTGRNRILPQCLPQDDLWREEPKTRQVEAQAGTLRGQLVSFSGACKTPSHYGTEKCTIFPCGKISNNLILVLLPKAKGDLFFDIPDQPVPLYIILSRPFFLLLSIMF